MLSNAYFLANIRFDTAENEPALNLQNNFLQNLQYVFANSANFAIGRALRDLPRREGLEGVRHRLVDDALDVHGELRLDLRRHAVAVRAAGCRRGDRDVPELKGSIGEG